jgi:hypothetical protein
MSIRRQACSSVLFRRDHGVGVIGGTMRILCAVVLAALVFPLNGEVQLPARSPDHFVRVNGVTLNYVDWGGSGDTLLFLPGGNDSRGESVHRISRRRRAGTFLGATCYSNDRITSPPALARSKRLAEQEYAKW